MSRGESTEMISNTLYVGWLYLKNIRNYLNDLIDNKGYQIQYEESLQIFQNKFVLYGTQRDIMYAQNKIQQYLNGFSF